MRLAPGRCTAEGTGRFRSAAVEQKRIHPSHFRKLASGLELGSIGLGTYIGAPDGPTDLAVEQAVQLSVSSGRVNVVDTALNYRYQRAERSVGRSLARLFESGRLSRDELFVSTKNGYLAPDAESKLSPQEWVDSELVRPGILRRSDIVDGSHAMTERFLADQLERSRVNLGLATIDLLYLHNAADSQLPVVGREEFLARLSAAFRLYERARGEGAVASYGLATWDCLRTARSSADYLSLAEAVDVARSVGGADHGFRFVQFPFSLSLPEAAEVRNQVVDGERLTLFDAAHRLGVQCFTSVPLHQGQLARDGPVSEGLTSAQTALQFARSAPNTVGPVVGLKRPEHISENLRLADRPPWDPESFERMLS